MSTSTGGSTGETATSGQMFDVGDMTGTEGAPGCDKIDFLFVIDDSGSMHEYQVNLIASFPGFISTIQDTVQAQDYQILVTTTGCNSDGLECVPDDCDHVLGAGHVASKDGVDCGVTGGNRYMLDGQSDLEGTFACIAEVGVTGNSAERMMDSMMAAVSPELGDPGQCNAGFVRDDAVLVVTFITDVEDTVSTGNHTVWKNTVAAAKGDREQSVVVLGVMADFDQCGSEAPGLRAFVDLFTYGTWAAICEPDYAPFFAEAVSVVDEACDAFTPEG